jgi:putative addiction module component (TIGR02574 family)
MSVDAILKQAEELSLDEQVELARRLWDRILDSGHESELTEAQKAELQRRLDRYRENPDDVVPWEVVKAQAQARARAKK